MQNANETVNQLQAAAQTSSQTTRTTVTATAATAASVPQNTADNMQATAASATTAAAVTTISSTIIPITADTKKERELTKKEMPLPKTPEYEWAIQSGDLDLLDKTVGEVVVYEKKLLKETPVTVIATAATTATEKPAASANTNLAANATQDPKDKKDFKETQENKLMLSHVAIGHFRTHSYDYVSKQWYPCRKKDKYLDKFNDITANGIILFFKGTTLKAVEDFHDEMINTIDHVRAISPIIDMRLEPMGPAENPTPYKAYVINYHSQTVVEKLFQFLTKKQGFFSEADADYFMKIAGYRASPYNEKEGMIKISKAITSRNYDTVLTELKALHEESIQVSRDSGIFFGADEESEQAIYFDPCPAAYEIGNKLLTLSPLHAFKAFDIFTKGSPYYEIKLVIAITFAERILNLKRLDPAVLTETIRFLLSSMKKTTAGPEGVGRAFNLMFKLMEQLSGNTNNLLREIMDLKELSDLMPTLADNIITIANRLYELKSGMALEQSTKEKSDTSSNTKSSAASLTATGISTGTAASGTEAAAVSIKPASTNGSNLVVDSKIPHDKTDASALPPSTMPTLPKHWKMNPLCDWKKFLEDTTHTQSIILFKETPSVDTKEHSEVQKTGSPLSNLSFNILLIIRLKETYYDHAEHQTKEKGEPILNLILLAPDSTMSKHGIASLPQNIIIQLINTHDKLKALDLFESSDDFIFNHARFIHSSPDQIGGTRVLGLRTGAMRQDLADMAFSFLQTFLGEELTHFIQELTKPWVKPIPLQETTLRKTIEETIKVVDDLNSLIAMAQAPGKNQNIKEAEELKQKRNVVLDSICQDAKTIHDWIRTENQARGLLISHEMTHYPLDACEIALELGKAFSEISPEHAYRVLDIMNPGSIYFDEAQVLMVPIAIDFAVSAGTKEKQRYYREKALRHLLKENSDYQIFLQFLKIHAGDEGIENVGANSLFARIKDKSMGADALAETCTTLCEQLALWNKKIQNTNAEITTAATAPNEMIISTSTAHAPAMTFSTSARSVANSAVTSQHKPYTLSTAATSAAATAAASLEQTAETTGKRIKSLEESDDEEDNSLSSQRSL